MIHISNKDATKEDNKHFHNTNHTIQWKQQNMKNNKKNFKKQEQEWYSTGETLTSDEEHF
jgi:hypothetical protein